ncbi:MAG: ArsC/Spx/MgsR family protein [Marmoricola sp.]
MEIWINPACSKCRTAKAALDEAGVAYTERRYLEDVPSAAEFAEVLQRLDLEPWHVARPAETREAGIDLPRDAEHREEWIAAMLANPRTIQRPIITTDDGAAVVARDDETLARVVDQARP